MTRTLSPPSPPGPPPQATTDATYDNNKNKNSSSNNNKLQQQQIPPPPPPADWDRCHFYVQRKNRYCRVRPVEHGRRYCGNHMEHETNVVSPVEGGEPGKGGERRGGNSVDVDSKEDLRHKNDQFTNRRRVPCHLCHTSVYETNLEKHIKICPVMKKRKLQENQPYFRENCNTGGSGLLLVEEIRKGKDRTADPQGDDDDDLQWAQQIARRVLQVHRSLFSNRQQGSTSSTTTQSPTSSVEDSRIEDVTLEELHTAIPTEDRASPMEIAGLTRALETHRIKLGGSAKHTPQLASLVGHLRHMQVLPPLHDKGENSSPGSSSNLVLVEMGSGRGLLGLTCAGVSNSKPKDSTNKTTLIMVERTGTRSKAEKHLRNPVPEDADRSYMKLDGINWSRVNCDLSHVHLPTVLEDLNKDLNEQKKIRKDDYLTTSAKTKDLDEGPDTTKSLEGDQNQHQGQPQIRCCVIAKHLCGAGTDLALKSLHSVRQDVDACILATCCHGVCDWQHYVGRDYLRAAMLGKSVDADDRLTCFGKAEFDLMIKWCGASVAHLDDEVSTATRSFQDDGAGTGTASTGTNISSIVKSLKLNCGIQGLGRACQRLVDFGRLQYLQHDVFGGDYIVGNSSAGNDVVIDLCHYTPPQVSPQNAILRAYRQKK